MEDFRRFMDAYTNQLLMELKQINKGDEKQNRLMSADKVGEYLGISEEHARKLIRGNNGFGVKVGRVWKADRKKLDAWIDRIAK